MKTKKVIRLLGPLMIEGVLSVRNHTQDRLVEMLHQLQFVTKNILSTEKEVVIELQIIDVELLYRLLAGEANKFFLASRVSHERSTQDQINNASWQAIESYYSAFYGVHYLLRLTGSSVTNLDDLSVKAIKRSNYGSSIEVPSGLYILKYDDISNILTLTKNKKKSGGGSHQAAWKLWDELVEKLRSGASIDPVEYADIHIELAEHNRFLRTSTARYNPPYIRGEINYQFRGGLWVFEKNSAKSVGNLQRSISVAKPAPLICTTTPEGLIINNMLIISLAKAVFAHATERYPKGICRSLSNKYKVYI
jgi:hypothetical protein